MAWAQDFTWGALSEASGNTGYLNGSCNNWGNANCAYTCCVLQEPDPCSGKVDNWGSGAGKVDPTWIVGPHVHGTNYGTTLCSAWAQDTTRGALSQSGGNTGDLDGSCNAWGNHGQCEHTCCVREMFPNNMPDALDLSRWGYLRQGNCRQGSRFMGMPTHTTIKQCACDCEHCADSNYFSWNGSSCVMYGSHCEDSDPNHKTSKSE